MIGMKETDKFKINEGLKAAILEDNKEHTKDNWEKVLGAILQSCHEGADMLLPVEIKTGQKASNHKSEVLFRLMQTPDGTKMLPVFTDPEAANAKDPQPLVGMSVKAILHRLMEMDKVEGLLINPFTTTFGVRKNAIDAVLATDKKMDQDRAGIYFAPGNIAELKIKCIVNSADPLFADGGGVDHAIYEAAGEGLDTALDQLESCKVSEAKITPGFDLPCHYIIHTVGPTCAPGTTAEQVSKEDKKALADCYTNSLNLAKQYDIHSIAFPAISTGLSGFPLEEAVPIAVTTVSSWLEENQDYGMTVVFSCLEQKTLLMYQQFMAFLKQKHDEVVDEYGSMENAEAHADDDGHLTEQALNPEEMEAQAARVAEELQKEYKNNMQ